MADDEGAEYTDQQAEEFLADAVGDEQESDQSDQDDAQYLQDRGKRALDSMKRERNAARKELSDLRARLQEYEDRDKSETQKLTEERDRLAVQVTEYQVREVRTQAALDAGLGADMAQFITGVDEETAAEQAKTLAEKVNALKSSGAGSDEPQYPQGFRGKGEKHLASVASGRDLYAQRHGKE